MECWGADKPFANITENNLTAKSIAITTLSMIESNILPSRTHCCDRNSELLPGLLCFRSLETEMEYQKQQDTNFPHYVGCSFLIFMFLSAIQFTLLPSTQLMMVAWSPTFMVLLFFACLTCLQSVTLQKADYFPSCLSSCRSTDPNGDVISKTLFIRIMLFVIITILISSCAMVVLIDSKSGFEVFPKASSTNLTFSPADIVMLEISTSVTSNNSNETTTFKIFQDESDRLKLDASVMSCLLCLVAVSVFLHVNFLLKSLVMTLISSCHVALFCLYVIDGKLSLVDERGWPLWLSILLPASFVTCMLHLFDRQVEATKRTDFSWRTKLSTEEEGVDTMRGINKILLENILPAHVAEHYLLQVKGLQPAKDTELYNERYENIAVMFASIPNYKEFYDENDINKQGLECLRLLNEIICDFDKLLSKPKFSVLEKIKTIGSTYMVAAGLQPGKEGERAPLREVHLCAILVEFAIQLMGILDAINRDSFQRFRLRAGLNSGCVVAGVVGAQKPQYDIWGNTVNVASRMESTGEMGRIQVTEEMAKVLMSAGYELEYRGPIFVKGKGMITTYFVKTAFDNVKFQTINKY